MAEDITDLDIDLPSDPSLLPPVLAAMAGLAGWVVPSLMGGIAGINSDGLHIARAWDTPLYWAGAVPAMILVLGMCGYLGSSDRWRLALWALVGHFVGLLWFQPEGSSLSLLPLTAAFVAAFLFPLLWIAAITGGFAARLTGRA